MTARSLWVSRGLFVVLSVAIIFVNLLPIGGIAGRLSAPDVLMALVFAWVLRRPDYVPIGIIVIVGLLGDALLNKPLGLWTLIIVLISDVLRRTVDQSVSLTPTAELSLIAPAILGAFLIERFALVLLAAQPPVFLDHFLHAGVTLLFYPVVAFVSQGVLGIRRLQPGELDSLGTRA